MSSSDDWATYRYHFDMLHDDNRNKAYAVALETVVTPETRVLDIGTGSGLLVSVHFGRTESSTHHYMYKYLVQGLMAAHLGAREVLGLEVVPELAAVAEGNARVNGLASFHVHNAHSTVIDTLPLNTGQDGGVDVIVGELLDTELIGEGVLMSMRHAASAFCTSGKPFNAIPASATVHCEIIESPWLWKQHCVRPVVESLGMLFL